jgi:ATP-binding cassette subfamily B protein
MSMQLKRLFQKSHILQTLALVPRASVPLSTVLFFLIVVTGCIPILTILRTGELVQAVGDASETGLNSQEGRRLLVPIVWLAALFLVQQILAPITRTITNNLGDRLSQLWRETVMEATLGPEGIAHLENPSILDKIKVASGIESRAFAPTQVVSALVDIVTTRLHGYAAAFLLAGHQLWMSLALCIAWALMPRFFAAQTRTQMKRTESQSASLRRSDYIKDIALRPGAAKEVRVFGLPEWLLGRFTSQRHEGLSGIWNERGLARWRFIPYILFPAAISALILWLLIREVSSGSIAISRFTVYALAIIGAKEVGRSMAWWTRSFFGAGSVFHSQKLKDHTHSEHSVLPGSQPAGALPSREVRFRDVSFAYPGTNEVVFESLNLTIPAGKSLAIVGKNGAGKTTLVKLLTRLYDPLAGEVLVDGMDLSSLDTASWRSNIAVIFQDFVRYELTARENVGLGYPGILKRASALETAAGRAGASELIHALPKGWETVLSRSYSGGVDLSGGEWQKIALARAFAAVVGGARLLILDEPTANLDVRSEAELFDRFLDLTKGLTTILISHRMSSIRHADRICVVDEGTITEEGTHNELIRAGGLYAEMFRLQAQHLQEAGDG